MLEIFKPLLDGTLAPHEGKLPVVISELTKIRSEETIKGAQARVKALHDECDRLGKLVRDVYDGGGDPRNDSRTAGKNIDGRCSEIRLVLIPAALGRLRELEAHVLRTAQEDAYRKALEADPPRMAVVRAEETVAKHEREAASLVTQLAGLTVDDRGDRIPAPPAGSDERLLMEMKLAEARAARLKARIELKAVVAKYDEARMKGRSKRLDVAMGKWADEVVGMVADAESFLRSLEKLKPIQVEVLSAGGSFPPIAPALTSALKLYVQRCSAILREREE